MRPFRPAPLQPNFAQRQHRDLHAWPMDSHPGSSRSLPSCSLLEYELQYECWRGPCPVRAGGSNTGRCDLVGGPAADLGTFKGAYWPDETWAGLRPESAATQTSCPQTTPSVAMPPPDQCASHVAHRQGRGRQQPPDQTDSCRSRGPQGDRADHHRPRPLPEVSLQACSASVITEAV